ncbi:unnamed protein product, partial [Prorocentrum cordatum]
PGGGGPPPPRGDCDGGSFPGPCLRARAAGGAVVAVQGLLQGGRRAGRALLAALEGAAARPRQQGPRGTCPPCLGPGACVLGALAEDAQHVARERELGGLRGSDALPKALRAEPVDGERRAGSPGLRLVWRLVHAALFQEEGFRPDHAGGERPGGRGAGAAAAAEETRPAAAWALRRVGAAGGDSLRSRAGAQTTAAAAGARRVPGQQRLRPPQGHAPLCAAGPACRRHPVPGRQSGSQGGARPPELGARARPQGLGARRRAGAVGVAAAPGAGGAAPAGGDQPCWGSRRSALPGEPTILRRWKIKGMDSPRVPGRRVCFGSSLRGPARTGEGPRGSGDMELR